MKLKNIFWTKWKIIRTIWPYRDGYGVYRKHILTGEKVVLETGLKRVDAERIAKEENNHST